MISDKNRFWIVNSLCCFNIINSMCITITQNNI